MADNKKFSGKNLSKLIIVPILVVLLIVGSFFALVQGIINIFKETAKEAVGEIAEGVNRGIQWLGLARVSRGLPTFIVNKEQVEALRMNLENQAIKTDVCGMTEVRLRKMLLAYAVSSSLSDTVCAVETTEEDIINNFKEKNKEYKDDDSVTINTVLNKYGSTSSVSKWKVSNPNYTLYNTDESSKVFFYFKDTDKMFGDNENAWFLGAMGATTIETADGASLTYVTASDFSMIKTNFNAASVGDKLNSQAYKQMLSSYTRNGDVIKLYTVDISQKEYYFSFENKNIQKIEEPAQAGDGTIKYNPDEDSVYSVGVQEINLSDSVDLSKYAIPIELMMDFLNITGSGEFLETFIDYSLEQVESSVMAYTLKSEEVAYNERKYNIDRDFVLEMYDIIDYGITTVAEFDAGEDNFKAYYDIVYNRRYNGRNLPENKVTSIPDYKSINYNDLEYDTDKKYSVDALESYLKTAYDPNAGFDLGDIEVTEVITNKKIQNKWQLMVNKIGTWYGNFTYTLADPKIVYSISEEPEAVTEEKYNEYNHTKMTDFIDESDKEKEAIYLYSRLKSQVENEIEAGKIDISKCELQSSNDIYDNAMKVASGADNREHFQNWAIRGLEAIAEEDNGEKNARMSGGTGIDYIYCKYKEINVKRSNTAYKRKVEVINESNFVQTTSNDDIDQKLKNFLELLRNETGKIPTSKGSEGGFTAKDADPSIVVKYADIYEGTIPAGDLLLDNGALMLFELLESADNTQGLVNVFKYLAYLYTGTDYGVTNVQELSYIFSLNSRTALYGNSIEEKIWFALRNAGISEVAAAGVIGNLYAESGLILNNLENTGNSRLGMSDEEYTNKVNSGAYTNFVNDGYGYGLAQWTYRTRKEGIYNYAKSKGVGVDDEQAQIEFLITEITGTGSAAGYATCQMNLPNKGYTKDDWKNATSVEKATEAFCYVFERPGIPNLEKRKTMAKQYYNTYKGKATPAMGSYTGTEGEKLCQAAQAILEHTTKYSYIYNVAVPDYSEGVRALWNKRGVCCASYVAWVLVESGVVSENYINKLAFRGATSLGEGLKKIFPTVPVSSMSDLQKGDIVVWPGHHVQMYAGNGYWYNGGAAYDVPPVKYSKYDALSYFRHYGYYYVLRPVQQ